MIGRLHIRDIQEAVARQFNIPVREMWSARRSRQVARPRQVAMYLSRELTPQSMPEIGRRFGNRDHTTVIHAIRRIEELQANDRLLEKQIRAVRIELEETTEGPDRV